MSYNLGLLLAVSALVLCLWSSRNSVQYVPRHDTNEVSICIAWIFNSLTSLALAIASVSLPRRPDVIFQGCEVDRQSTISALRRYTWSWIEPLRQQASVNNDLNPSEIPYSDHKLRTDELNKRFSNFEVHSTLLRSLLGGYKRRLGRSWLVTILQCLVNVMPYRTLLRTLELLESRETKASYRMELLGLVLGIALYNLIDSVGFLAPYTRSNIAMY